MINQLTINNLQREPDTAYWENVNKYLSKHFDIS